MNYLSTDEAAEQAGVTSATIRRWIREGALDGELVGGRWLVDADDLEDLLDENDENGEDEDDDDDGCESENEPDPYA